MLIVHLTSPPCTTSVAHRGSQNSHAGGEGPGGSRRTTLPLRFRGDSTMERIKGRGLFRRAGWGLGALAVSQMLSRLSMPGRAYAQATGTLTYGMAGGFDTLDVTATTFTRVGRIGLHLVDPLVWQTQPGQFAPGLADRKSTRLNSSHGYISYAVFCLKKKKMTRADARRDRIVAINASALRTRSSVTHRM